VPTVDLYRALWRHRLFITVLTAALLGAVWYLTSREQPVYKASSLIRVQQQIQDPGQTLGVLAAGAQLAETYGKIVGTTTVAESIYSDLHGQIPYEEIGGSVSASPVQGLDLLWINAKSTNRDRAVTIANAAPAALKRFINDTGTLRDEIITVQAASRPGAPVSPNLMLNLTVALLAGLIFNALLAVAIELVSDRVVDADEIESLTGHPVLASVPVLRFLQRVTPVEPSASSRRKALLKEVARG